MADLLLILFLVGCVVRMYDWIHSRDPRRAREREQLQARGRTSARLRAEAIPVLAQYRPVATDEPVGLVFESEELEQ